MTLIPTYNFKFVLAIHKSIKIKGCYVIMYMIHKYTQRD